MPLVSHFHFYCATFIFQTSPSVIKFYIGINTFHELTLGVILGPMDLHHFIEAKKDSATALSWRQPGFEKDWTTLFTRSSFRNVLDVFCGFWSL